MKLHRLLFPAALALLALAPSAGRAPSLAARAQASFSSFDYEEQPQPNAVADFLRAHGKAFFTGVAVALFIIFNIFMGPTGGGYGYRHGIFRRGGFGGFGGGTSMKNPWE